MLSSLAARVPSDRYFYTWVLQTPATQETIVRVLCAEVPGLDRAKVKKYVMEVLGHSRSNCRRSPDYTPAMQRDDERAEDVQRARLEKAALGDDDGTEEDDAVPQPTCASPSAGRGPFTPDDGNQQRGKGKRALEIHGRDGGRAPVAKKAALQPSVAAAPAAPAGPSPRAPTASAGASDTVSGDLGKAPSACPPSAVAGGILGAVDAFLAVEGTMLADPWQERLRGVIRAAAAREQASRAELARRATQLGDQLREAVAALE